VRYRLLDTPTGPFAICEDDAGELHLTWVDDADDERLAGGAEDPALRSDLAVRLERYFAGTPVDFADVPLPDASRLRRGADEAEFFSRCWAACRTIERGTTRTYGQLAEMAGATPAAARVAGQSMRHNPLPIVIPCHRVVAAGDRLGGFGGSVDPAGRNLQTKRWLLTMEGAIERGLFD